MFTVLRKLIVNPSLNSGVMRKNLTNTLLCLLLPFALLSQNSSNTDLTHIITPYRFVNESSINGKNLYFEYWVKGKLLLADNSVVNGDNYYFNFDKIEHKLLITSDFRSIYEIDRREFKAILFYLRDTGYVFKHISYINDKDLFQVMVNESTKYSLFKVVHTKLVKGVYNGMYTSSGLTVTDKYMDATEYFIFFPNKEYRVVHSLKKAALEKAFLFNPDSDKVSDYLNGAGEKSLEEKDLMHLIAYLNDNTTSANNLR